MLPLSLHKRRPGSYRNLFTPFDGVVYGIQDEEGGSIDIFPTKEGVVKDLMSYDPAGVYEYEWDTAKNAAHAKDISKEIAVAWWHENGWRAYQDDEGNLEAPAFIRKHVDGSMFETARSDADEHGFGLHEYGI